MPQFQRLIVAGNLTRDPELRYSQAGLAIASAAIAINERRQKDGQWVQKTLFLDFAVFGKRAEAFAKHFTKGKPVLLEGRLDEQRWEDKQTGAPRSKLKMMVDSWHFLESSNKSSDEERPLETVSGGEWDPNLDDTPF